MKSPRGNMMKTPYLMPMKKGRKKRFVVKSRIANRTNKFHPRLITIVNHRKGLLVKLDLS